MVFLIFAPLAFLVLRLTFKWRLRTVLLAALVIGVTADVVFGLLAARPP